MYARAAGAVSICHLTGLLLCDLLIFCNKSTSLGLPQLEDSPSPDAVRVREIIST